MRRLRVPLLLLVVLLSLPAFAQQNEAACPPTDCPPRFAYCGFPGPPRWSEVPTPGKPNECGGNQQSPLPIPSLTSRAGATVHVRYNPSQGVVVNNGYEIKFELNGGNNYIQLGDDETKQYVLRRFHFHTPIEHTTAQGAYNVEMHLVHEWRSDPRHLAVIAVWMRSSGSSSGVLAPLFAAMPTSPPLLCKCSTPITLNLNALLGTTLGSYYTYTGSLTTPPCTQNPPVTFFIRTAHLTLATGDYQKLSSLGPNARPPQNPNGRSIVLIQGR